MIIYPAIDLLNGECVRLYKGDYAQKTAYSANPISMAKSFEAEGATWLHIVDLTGAKDPNQRQTKLIAEITQSTGLNVQTGGGIRTLNDVEALLNTGAKRIIIGSLAVKNPSLVQDMLKNFGAASIVLALDCVNGNVAISGWQEETQLPLTHVIEQFLPAGLQHILCTDISRDGTLSGTNTQLYQNLHSAYPSLHIQASGGVGSLADIAALPQTGVAGVIVGKALYEQKFTLQQALAAAC